MADIAVCSECAGEMDVTAASPFNRVACPGCGAEVRVKVDFGNYLLQKRLAFGGMSIVFVAVDQTLGREVALKVLNEEYSSDEFRTAQFEKEAELTALVSHPNVVRVYSVGRAFERFYIAMELISGDSLEKLLETGKGLPEREVLEIALQVTAGLKEAKASGLIHRDIKPGNILVDSEGGAKIVDFGLSLVTQSGSARAEEIFATPYYAPPEALEAGVEDFRSDIYALGASLYHALAGKPPIETKSTNTKTLLEAKLKAPPLHKVAPQVSQSTADAVTAMMAFQKEARPSSYDVVKTSLERALNGEDQLSRTSKSSRTERSKSSGLTWVVVPVLLALVIVALFALKNRGDGKEEDELTPPKPPVVKRGDDEGLKISRIYQRGREALAEGRFNEAELNFLKLYRQREVPEPTGTWSGFEAGMSALLDGRGGDTRSNYEKLHDRVVSAGLDPETQVVFEDVLKAWNDFEPSKLPSECSSAPEIAMLEFAQALKNWELGERDVVPFLDSFVAMEFKERKEWVETYQAWAAKLAADAQRLSEAEPDWERVWSSSEIEAELKKLESLSKSLETTGRAQMMAASWKDWFKGLEARREKRPWESREE
ncbi:MAG: serine/threonine-protein kinase [Roseibacillus sp.]